jgi:hypothetical protein
MGYDPLYQNPYDPVQRPLNQPRFVQYILSILKINQGQTTVIGILFILLFFVGVLIALKPINHSTAALIAAVMFSPALILGMERANHDLFVFFLVALALFVSRYPLISALILLLASFIKLFPMFALSYFFKYEKKTQIFIFSGFIFSMLLYLIVFAADWPQVFNATQKSSGTSAYGVLTYSEALSPNAYIPFSALVISSLAFYANSLYAKGFKMGDTNHIDAFRAGAGIYIGTFCLGSIWVYRLMFLILTIPQLVAWRKDKSRGFVALLALVSILFSCWSMFFRGLMPAHWMIAIDEVSNWVAFSTIFYLMLSSMPVFVQKSIVQVVHCSYAFTGKLRLPISIFKKMDRR